MADYNVSTDFLPAPQERTGSMSLGGASENGALSNGAAADSPTAATASAAGMAPPAEEVPKEVQEVLASEIGISTMLTRLKQSIASVREFAGFLQKRAQTEDHQANALKKLARTTTENMHRSEHLGGSFAQAYDDMMAIHERMAENGYQFSTSLQKMHEDLAELASIADKNRKGWKQNGLAAEQRVADLEAQMRKSQAKYHSLADEYDRVRTGDSGGQKGAKMFGFKGPKSAAQHEEDLLRKVQAADQDYQTKVQTVQTEKRELVERTRPEVIKALQDIIKECDTALLLQMQKFASFNEKLLLSNGLSVSPLKNAKGVEARASDALSLREIVLAINNERDLSEYIRSNHSRVPPQTGEPKYEPHPVLGRVSGSSLQQPPPIQPLQSQTIGASGPPPQLRPQSSLPSPPPAGQPPFGHRPQQSASFGYSGSPGGAPVMSGAQRPSSSRGQPQQQQQQQHERSFSHTSMGSQGGPPSQQQYPPPGQGPPNPRFNGSAGGPASQQGPPQLGALSFQTSAPPPPAQDRSSQGLARPTSPPAPNGAPASMSVSQGPPPAQQMPPTRPVFGVSLQRLYERDGLAVPMVVYQCIQAVDLFGLNVEGIYRLSGSVPHVNRLKGMFDTDSSSPALDFRNPENFFHDVNSVAGLLKQFFRDLPDPLLTREHYSAFIEAAKSDDDIVRRDSLHAIINSLPDPNYATLRALTLHLYRVMENSHLNRMNNQNLAIVFGPTLMGTSAQGHIADAGWQVRVVDTILQNTYQIFDDD